MLKLSNVKITALNNADTAGFVSTNPFEDVEISQVEVPRGYYTAFLLESDEDITAAICAYMEQIPEKWTIQRSEYGEKAYILIQIY